jgi:hypothetical protein
MFIVGPTGVGKTMLLMAMAGGMITGRGFLNWRADRPSKVLFIDGEMPLRRLRERMELLQGQLQLPDLPNLHYVSWQEAHLLPLPTDDKEKKDKDKKDDAVTPRWAHLNTPEGQAFVLKLCDLIQPDVVFLDNVQALVAGDMTTEMPWNETTPFVLELTRRQICQIWADHTGHDTSHQYGSDRKRWAFDTSLIAKEAPREDSDLALAISFLKNRNRTPENGKEYEHCIIRLRNGEWTTDGLRPDAPGRPQPTKNERVALKMLDEAMQAFGFMAPVFDGNEGQVVRVEDWRTYFYDHAKPGEDADTKRKAFGRARDALLAKQLIGSTANMIWPR